jgi:hypothetical protein
MLSRPYWHILEVSLVTDESLAKPVGSQWEGNMFIKNAMLKSDVLDLNGANNAASNCVNQQHNVTRH